ncbi:Selenocysteine lyase/Cysteine desulfurase [Clostridium cavendishii DSM 21758]|uniref:Selenocysteine lyase/Cysteine desulfurase n=1 Tax=Clostridium cavendishii DSM 21758 TaxID=1121302 RepID=A0A1M6CQ70_9CLOT|nr:aminotransferase class V-fold PLP-dependent enzyme [Clostridium cavendishii]SHI63177.1 Selenocysteine lyase/Cysteine desulfurase [Clostridium cavendishii DSM 21758]
MDRDVNYRDLFIGLDNPVKLKNGKSTIPINFDNGATTPPFKMVGEYIENFIPYYSSVGRGKGQKAKICTEFYEKSRGKVLRFLNVKNINKYEVMYVKNTTEGINLLSNILWTSEDDVVLSTRMEHHSNDLPWRNKWKIDYVEVGNDGSIDVTEIEKKLIEYDGKIKYVTITGSSNVTGYVNPINEIAKIAHKYDAKIIVDAAQLVAHRVIFLEGKENDDYIDFIVFSAHKMYAPFGIGVVAGRKENLSNVPPFMTGGGTVDIVLDNEVYYTECPYKEEAGTQNLIGVVALLAGIRQLELIGFKNIENHEEVLKNYLMSGISNIRGIKLYGNNIEKDKLCVISFNSQKLWHESLAIALADIRGIAVRDGCFCAQPYVKRLLSISDQASYRYLVQDRTLRPGMVRTSLGLYNSIEEIDEFLNTLEYIQNHK